MIRWDWRGARNTSGGLFAKFGSWVARARARAPSPRLPSGAPRCGSWEILGKIS